jgi:hypothetical protein
MIHMDKNFELRLINVTWLNKGKNDQDQTFVSPNEIPLVAESEHCFTGAMTSHPRFRVNGQVKDAQWAVRCTSDPEVRPSFASNCKPEDKIPVHDKDGVSWWIEKHSWDDKKKYWKARSHTTAGMVTIQVGSEHIELEIYPQFPNAEAQYERMRDDFLDGLSGLLLDDDSPVMKEMERNRGLEADSTGSHKASDKHRSIAQDYDQFIQALKIVMDRPRTQLHRRPGMLPAHQGQRDVTVLREFATRPNARHVSGLVAEEHPDTPENRYLIWMAQDIIKQMKREEAIFSNQRKRWLDEKVEKDKQLRRFEHDPYRKSNETERKHNVETLRSEMKRVDQNIKHLDTLLPLLEQGRQKIERLRSGVWHSLRASHLLPKSSVFSRDPRYSRCLRLYRMLKRNSGSTSADQNKLDHLHFLEYNGIQEWHSLYERWCLLRILTVLTRDFCFTADIGDWRSRLLDAYIVSEKTKKEHEDRSKARANKSLWSRFGCSFRKGERLVEVYWERELDVAGEKYYKLPDFTLFLYRVTEGSEKLVSTVVMDAKSHPYKHSLDATHESYKFTSTWDEKLAEIAKPEDKANPNRKNYLNINPEAKEGTNNVFLLHCSEQVQDGTSPQYYVAPHFPSYYGGWYRFEDPSPNHRSGSVLATVAKPEPLKRLLYMCLQYLMEEEHRVTSKREGKIDPKPDMQQFCIGCGGNLPQSLGKKNYKKTGWTYEYICDSEKCSKHLRVNYCWHCKNRLYKLDEEWTYHNTMKENFYNIVCPLCGESHDEESSRNKELDALRRQYED